MKLRMVFKAACVVSLAAILACGFADTSIAKDSAVAEATAQTILKSLRSGRPDFVYGPVKPTAVNGLYEVEIVDGPTLYVTEDGKQFIAGDLFVVEAGQFVNMAEQKRQQQRADKLAAVDLKDMIVFAPEKTKALVYVFTDVDCGYCQKFHSEMSQLNAAGIEVRYLAFPRAGIGSRSYKKIVTAWCSVDRNGTLTKLKNGQPVPDNLCEDNPVAKQYELGERLGVRGTPALFLADGTALPGYRPPAEQAAMLGIK